jgi:uncharacterized protein (TIRG00374 family)
MADKKKFPWKTFITGLTLLALTLLIYGLRDEIAGVISNIGRVNAYALLLIIPIEVLNYDAYARLYRSFFAILSEKVGYKFLYRLTLELNFVNHILPSGGVSGISYFSLRMRSQGVSAAKSTLSQVVKFFLLFVSFQPLLILGLFFLAIRGHANNLVILVSSSLITLLVVGTLIGIYIIDSRSRINTFLLSLTKATNWTVHIFRRNNPEVINLYRAKKAFNELHDNYVIIKKDWRKLKKPFIYTTVANITEIAAVYIVYVAFGQYVNVGAVILAYAVANFAGLISVLPAGIGIYEALMTAVLAAAGIPAEVSIPVTIMYRVLSMTTQLIPGYYFYQKAVHEGLSGIKQV